MTGQVARPTAIPGLLLVDLAVHRDERGWFKENWNASTMAAAGLPDLGPVQHNVSFNAGRGVTRGIHAEPWDKLVSVLHGKVFAAWVDLRPGESFGRTVTATMDETLTAFVPRGVANAFQALAPETVYSYLVNQHWSAAGRERYTYVNLADPTLAIAWPIPLAQAQISAADLTHPQLTDVRPMAPRSLIVLGAHGQVGRAVAAAFDEVLAYSRADVDVTDPEMLAALPWASAGAVVNAAAATAVDAAETEEGFRQAWRVNVDGAAHLAAVAREHRLTVVQLSSDYVFDGSAPTHHEDEPVSPLGRYGITKAAADAVIASLPRHYIVRTSWVIGEGHNFVRTMARLADSGACPQVVDDQFGRLTFAADLAAVIKRLLDVQAPFGTYNVTCRGEVMSWADIARAVFVHRGRRADDVVAVSTAEYVATRPAGTLTAPRPRHSTLALDKLEALGIRTRDGSQALTEYLAATTR